MDKEIEKAIILAIQAHSGQYRKQSKNPYYIHPIRVAEKARQELENIETSIKIKKDSKEQIVIFNETKKNIIISSLLHDTIEDTWVTLEYIKKEFGEKIAEIVNELTKTKTENRQKCEEEYKKKLIQASDEAKFIKILDIEDSLNDPFDSERWNPYLIECELLIKELETKNKNLKPVFDKIKQETLKKLQSFSH